ncbi:hypothetical protein G9H64_08555 [Aquirufa nivalisilvae]|uniref:hypothetical protein n=1 Tax=Aquirufa nivalisilvae TaxID=2516557 RepID=UPI0022A8DA30|nr:hypothetical protein [Aquirufa nivalisilvae]MCZ2483004.1 hypothetical protein [Aquirufa nivalisilvae]
MEKLKFICGLTLVAFAIIGGLIFFLESFLFINKLFSMGNTSHIWRDGSGASNTPIFLGQCGLSGAHLLASVKPIKVNSN